MLLVKLGTPVIESISATVLGVGTFYRSHSRAKLDADLIGIRRVKERRVAEL
jgi:hypothetical protein